MFKATSVNLLLADWKKQGVSKADIVRWQAECYLGWQYVYASQGQNCTPEWRKSRIPYCPSEKYVSMITTNCPVLSEKQSACDGCDFVDTDVFDCAGFVLSLLQRAGVPFYGQGATTQWVTASNWVAKGTIDTMPKNLVCCVYKHKDGKMVHAGMSMGDGNGGVIHCSTTVKRGNAYTDYSKWTHWGIPKSLYSVEELQKAGIKVSEHDNMPTLRRGNTGDLVKVLQDTLNTETNAGLTVDGIFGAKTEAAVKKFQTEHGLASDGIVGAKTWQAFGVLGNIDQHVDNEHHSPTSIDISTETLDEAKTAIKAAYASAKMACDILKKLLEES